ncbi:uncharacterized protein LOC128683754 [Plodia interpunctella]|uniref:uncharacterized protein LOC128683754 n=1 Tax=Plodia interpunctella TaxID=58824 RepID=UPI00236761FB|nr:uncharacterized protein LOC128683754 [Plodia interpunctella]
MTLRTPRRRISPRTKRRYRAIKDFLRRAIGSSSQPDIKINSSIAVNVTNLKHQIVGIERQLNEVSKHFLCTDCVDSNESTSSIGRERSIAARTVTLKADTSTERNSRESKTKFLFQKLNDRKVSDESDLVEHSESDRNYLKHVESCRKTKTSPKIDTKSKESKHRQRPEMEESQLYYGKQKSKSTYGRFSSSFSTSYHSLIDPRYERTLRADYDAHHHTARNESGYHRHRTHERAAHQHSKHIPYIESKEVSAKRIVRNEDKRERRRKDKTSRERRELDPDFIDNIIQRQYRPVTMFGRRESNVSQFSAPICRDQEFKSPENILLGSDLCSCCYTDRKHRTAKYNDVSDMRSICDTRLYSSKKNIRHKTCRRQSNYNYNDTSMYDVVPVREKYSPKMQRKIIEDLMCYSNHKEVPPSPRTLRPRLNLKAQNFSNMDMDEVEYYNSRRHTRNRNDRPRHYSDCCSNKSSSLRNLDYPYNMETNKREINQQIMGTTSYRESIQSPQLNNEATNTNQAQAINTTINKLQDIESTTDKTDKALCEIKDILQHFLQEIKKESVSLDSSSKSEPVPSAEIKQNTVKANTTFDDPSSQSDTNNCSLGPLPLPQPFLSPHYLNPCCYPVFPTYPINCMQNSFVVPSPSCTCACTNKPEKPLTTDKDTSPNTNIKKINNNTETDKLIKEIYNLVTQSPRTARKKDDKNISSRKEKPKPVVTRSVGDSIKLTRHDVKVGTPKLKLYSKSCEAIGSPLDEEHTARTTASYSDTVIGKLSLEATAAESTSTETEISTVLTTSTEKKDHGRISKVLHSFGLIKKKKKDVIEEEDEDESESESSTEVEIRKKRRGPEFPQEIINYAMHGQEFFHLPPIPPPHLHHEYLAHQPNLLHHHYSAYPGYPSSLIQPTAPPCPCVSPHGEPQYHHHSKSHHNPHYNHQQNYYNPQNRQPEVPLCLKEIEVKSTATQSDRKLPFFGKFGRRSQEMAPLIHHHPMPPPKTISTQTKQNKPSFWQKLNTPKPMTESDPRMFSFRKQKELLAGDAKLKNAMLKKLFHKRNPFSPNNLIVKTLMGRDPSSFGDAPVMQRPKMFL